MALAIRIYGTVDVFPSMDEIIEQLEESDFEVTLETEEDEEDEENWQRLYVYESSLDEPISIDRFDGSHPLREEIDALKETLQEYEQCAEGDYLQNTLDSCAIAFAVEAPEEIAEDDNALMLATLIAQIIAQRTDGVYCVDSEGFFNQNGDLIFELANED